MNENRSLEGKTILLMGVANPWSIAYAIGQAMLDAGATLALSYLDERMKKDCEKLIKDSPTSKLYPCNVESDEEIDVLAKDLEADYGTIDGYVHSIAFAPAAELTNPFRQTTRAGFATAMSVSVYSLIAVSARLVPLMPNGGSITTLTYLGADRAFPQYNVMGVAKAGLESAVRYLAYDLGQEKIRVNAISAGPVKTASARGIPGFSSMVEMFGERAPLKDTFNAKDVAQLAVFLASDGAKAITAETIFVDNGYHAMGM
jgi:enoyl-[acyl-carrier protein] reductase I